MTADDDRGQGGEDKHQVHPGGSAAVLGVRLIRFSGVQGTSLVIGNLLQLGSIVAVARFLGPAELGRFALLFFLAGLISAALSLAVRPGTIRRVFGADDEDDGDEDDEGADVSESPPRTLGVGLLFAVGLGLTAAAATIVWREPIADLLLGDPGAGDAVLWAGIMGGAGVLFKLSSIVIWMERRPAAFLLTDTSRPVLGLAGTITALASGAGVEGALAGAAIGNVVAAALGLWLLRSSFEPAFGGREVAQIVRKGAHRAPIVMSFWALQNADTFLLSRFVDHTDVGIYTLGSRLGIVAAILPQGFRVSMRALRKSVAYQAVRDQYGVATAAGQLLGYFVLLCITAVLATVLAAELMVNVAPAAYADAAPLIPFAAAAFAMPAVLRTTNGQTGWPGKSRRAFVLSVVGGTLLFVGISVLLMPSLGIYGAPVAILVALGIPTAYLFVRCQRSERRIAFPYSEVLRALAIAAVIGGGFWLLPDLNDWVEVGLAGALMLLYLGLLVLARVVPEYHWEPLLHMARSVVSGRPEQFNPRAGLRVLDPLERQELRAAIRERIPPERLSRRGQADDGSADGERLVAVLRRAGKGGGVAMAESSEHDALIARFLFARAPIAVRDATMRRLLAEGADSGDLRALEDLVAHLARVPEDAWEGRPRSGRRRRLLRTA